ncbi:bifunctional phosphopantothenoylcysteine decarboxylase/phosphopantothenate--cysteine ligase CoaBC [Fonticella tunisiensis]|uniref:Coenzyme A biosynthesis bifunctional protein CoaBC n=1 Tax=Fonticella tunisiensis TaxID=1096341 RepID=A0A4R7KU01_9CLOT|nr:bifunctional phosphopantothenoylcysteine decarboxylase/phosphopantothenate--cysteine ligase CoaBC [Fonticella tunisiensis]TDT61643.1 phosphopantothenoylcysteine decarboxylase/phosphopantothenate--cysteine ligase [Fonticella tunisiensis]
MFENKTVVLGVSGGIAAYKALDIVSKLKKKNINVHVIMTESAKKFVTPLSFQALSQNYVISDMFQEPKSWEIQHISLAEKADLFVIAPATANVIGKIAGGIADDMLTTTVMATKAPVLIAPAMNTNMYENPIVQRNISFLKSLNYYFVEPDEGRLACGVVGKGKLADTEKIVDVIEMLLYEPKDLTGKKILVTAGPTQEDIDPVRYITNRSTGKMGYAIARAARNRGAEVVLISGPTGLKPVEGVELVKVHSADDMYNEVLKRFDKVDIVIKSAAVADYRPETKSTSKLKKSDDDLSISLTRNKDILQTLGGQKTNQILVGFAAESDDLINNALSKISKKNLDMIVANDITMEGAGFAVDTNRVKIILRDGRMIESPIMTKEELAHVILDHILTIER